MKKLIVGLVTSIIFSQAFACELLVKDVKLSAQERQEFESKGFRINEVQNFSLDDAGKMVLIDEHMSDGADILWFDLSEQVYKIGKFWNYSDVQSHGKPAIKYLDYVARSKSLKSIDSCDGVEDSLNKMINRIIRSQMYPMRDDKHGAMFLED